MWCDKCQADVATMASSDNERLYCTSCGGGLSRPAVQEVQAAPAPADAAPMPMPRDPRELLARWAREDALEQFDFAAPAPREATAERKSVLRFDASHPALSPPPAAFIGRAAMNPIPAAPPAVEIPAPPEQKIVVHQAHGPNAPHIYSVPVSMADKSSKWVTLVGQLFAYLGVGGLTVGTVLVLMGYFGGPATYATTGWLITTAGQMLLFLGVITLVSGGMEQTTQEVARRIDTLGERLVRIEQAAWNGHSEKPPHRAEVDK